MVLSLVGLLAGLVIINIDNIFDGAKKNTARTMVKSGMGTVIKAYMLDVGNYPKTLEDLKNPPSKGSNKRESFLDSDDDLIDPWDNPYQYRYPAQKSKAKYDVWSNGPDGISGNEDDIGNWSS